MNNMPLATDTVIPKYDQGHLSNSGSPLSSTPCDSSETNCRSLLVLRRFHFVWRFPWHDHHPKWFGLHRQICQSQPPAISLRQAPRNIRLLIKNTTAPMNEANFFLIKNLLLWQYYLYTFTLSSYFEIKNWHYKRCLINVASIIGYKPRFDCLQIFFILKYLPGMGPKHMCASAWFTRDIVSTWTWTANQLSKLTSINSIIRRMWIQRQIFYSIWSIRHSKLG